MSTTSGGAAALSASIADALAGRRQRLLAFVVVLAFAAITAAAAPAAAAQWPNLPAFVPVYQVITATCYLLTAYLLAADYAESGCAALLYVAGGATWTALVLVAQLLSVPGVVGPERALGGAQTTIHLWMWWHVGPPLYALLYAWAVHRFGSSPIHAERRAPWLVAAFALTVFAFLAVLALVTRFHDLLPVLNDGKDFRRINSTGVGPAVTLLTVAALVAVWRVTRGRTVLQLWLAVSLAILVLDNLITMAGGVRDTAGWYLGRLQALVSAALLLVVFLHQMRASARKAAQQAIELARASEQLRLDAEQRLAAEQASVEQQKLEMLGQLTGTVAHDFANLLQVLMLSLRIAEPRTSDAKALAALATSRQAIGSGQRLVQQLLAFARRQPLEVASFDLNARIRERADLFARSVSHRRLAFELADDLWPVEADAGQLELALMNLLVNACDATPEDGCITIATRNQSVGQEHAALAAGEYVVVEVRDEGVGMSPQTRARAFEPFFTTKPAGKGTGLGLSMVYGFATQSGGIATLDSDPGRGTTVAIHLPKGAGTSRFPIPEARTAAQASNVVRLHDAS